MSRCQLDALRWHEICKGVMVFGFRRVLVYGTDNILIGLWPRDAKHLRVDILNSGLIFAHTASDDYLAILRDSFTNGL